MFEFKMSKLNSCVGLAALLASLSSVAAETATMTITGAITPAACDIVFENKGSIALGNTSMQKLDAVKLTKLDKKTINFSVTCDAEVKVALNASPRGDVLALSNVPGAGNMSLIPTDIVVPFDRINDKAPGYYLIAMSESVNLDAKPGVLLFSENSIPTGNWSITASAASRNLYAGINKLRFFAYRTALVTNNMPVAARTINGSITVEPYLARKVDVEPGALNSTATLSITYL